VRPRLIHPSRPMVTDGNRQQRPGLIHGHHPPS
jgi:hypothetical protein